MKIIDSFKYAFRGLMFCIKNERNFRIHIVAALFVVILSHLYQVTESKIPLLVFSIIFVFVTEMINTSIEAIVDFVSPSYSEMGRIAKDVAAGAVLVAALSAVIIALTVFGNTYRLLMVWYIITHSWFWSIFIIAFIILSLFFIFSVKKERKDK